MSFLQIVAVLFFLVYLFFALCLKQTVMEAEGDVSLTCCYCELTADAKEISKEGKPHVHCPCEKCMTAWGHMNSERQQSSQPSPAKKARKTLEELDSSTLENLVEYEAHEFELESAFCFEDTYSEFPHSSDVCAGADRAGHDYDDNSITDYSSAGGSRSADDDETGSFGSDDEEESVKKFVQDSVLRLVEMKQKMGCSINHFEELLQWGKIYIQVEIMMYQFTGQETGMMYKRGQRNWVFRNQNIIGFVSVMTILVTTD